MVKNLGSIIVFDFKLFNTRRRSLFFVSSFDALKMTQRAAASRAGADSLFTFHFSLGARVTPGRGDGSAVLSR
ncbi:hypothetical protein [Candidatus Binatus sp.]|uniref:hypothetical protein n=1 Tax=Candidatus Binatus sp. TaxID=2811406 RepID=UPI002FDB304B